MDVLLSEEGGRFYHEQNRNIIIDIEEDFKIPKNYFWVDYATLNQMIQFNNVCNIQLRNLISLLEI
ncbi:NDP-hexose 2,3-dehydratase family protein [Allocoprobacillus halotolerans]|uniref:NDP-hexose 2,3-dehydratase family protein n=1 Tax=Allocoprobacillus halotolerans TaxID=2944914 RepID=A0ABY5I665_9FIRM|nr:NDP-hexose 2,3-dehydratase family protein [Allocoprobacillus halotolerans]UTY40839.1 NDP-hexose 2,3-dehydratase family protein [Allocoprobacillus halotolerans]